MGAQVETTQQYSSTFIVLPAQWRLALRWARLIIQRLWTILLIVVDVRWYY